MTILFLLEVWLERIKVEPESTEKEVPNDWSSFHVLVDGDRVQVWRDGKSIVDYRDTTGWPAVESDCSFAKVLSSFETFAFDRSY